jgi:hypothetical protein
MWKTAAVKELAARQAGSPRTNCYRSVLRHLALRRLENEKAD